MSYITTKINDVITQVARTTNIPGFTVGVIEIMFPDDEELEKWSKKQKDKWISTNNKRMKAICDFLNENEL